MARKTFEEKLADVFEATRIQEAALADEEHTSRLVKVGVGKARVKSRIQDATRTERIASKLLDKLALQRAISEDPRFGSLRPKEATKTAKVANGKATKAKATKAA